MQPEELLNGLTKTMAGGLFIDPLLVHSFGPKHFGNVYDLTVENGDALYEKYGTVQHGAGLSDLPYSIYLTRFCLVDTLLSSAITYEHESTGQIIPSLGTLAHVKTNLENFIKQIGLETLYLTYYGIVGHDLLEPFVYYKEMTEAEYFSSARHYPYRSENLDIILLIALYRHVLRLRFNTHPRTLTITRTGMKTYQWMQECFIESGYLQRRMAMSHLYQFDSVRNVDDLSDVVWPQMAEIRRMYLKWLDFDDNSNVLEMGCGTGSLTFDAGLYGNVPDGSVTGVDSAADLLEQAHAKHLRYGKPQNVTFTLAPLESLPFPDESFDHSCGSFFLQFTEPARVIGEMCRVTRAGGTVSVVQATEYGLNEPFLRDWFEPVFDLSDSLHDGSKATYVPTTETIFEWFRAAQLVNVETVLESTAWAFDNPEAAVQHMSRNLRFFQTKLASMPWDVRNTLIKELVDRGRDICRKYPLAERTLRIPTLMVRGYKAQRPK